MTDEKKPEKVSEQPMIPVRLPTEYRDKFKAWCENNGKNYSQMIVMVMDYWEEFLKDKEAAWLAREDIEAQRKKLDLMGEREAAIAKREAELDYAQVRLTQESGVAQAVREFLAECMTEGLTKGDAVSMARVFRASGLDPLEITPHIHRLGGVVKYIQIANVGLDKARDELREAQGQETLIRQTKELLGREIDGLIRQKKVLDVEIKMAQEYTQAVTATAAEMGIFVDWLRGIGVQRLDRLPLEMIRCLVGAILVTGVQTHGDEQTLRSRYGYRCLLSDLPGMLAAPETYDELRAAAQALTVAPGGNGREEAHAAEAVL